MSASSSLCIFFILGNKYSKTPPWEQTRLLSFPPDKWLCSSEGHNHALLLHRAAYQALVNFHFLWAEDKSTRSLCCIELSIFSRISGLPPARSMYLPRCTEHWLVQPRGSCRCTLHRPTPNVGDEGESAFSASTATSGIFSSVPWSHFLELEDSLCELRHRPGDWQSQWKSFKQSLLTQGSHKLSGKLTTGFAEICPF